MDEATARETYIGVLSDVACMGPPRTEGEQGITQLERACAAHGITLQQFADLAQRFGNDPTAQREVTRWTTACVTAMPSAARK
jgi:hypothetical protein